MSINKQLDIIHVYERDTVTIIEISECGTQQGVALAMDRHTRLLARADLLIRQSVPNLLAAHGYASIAFSMKAIRPIRCVATGIHAACVLHHISESVPDGPIPFAEILFWCEAMAHSAACNDVSDFLTAVRTLNRYTDLMVASLHDH